MFCVQINQMRINDGNLRRNWVCVFRASKENMELNGTHYKGVRDISSGRVGSTKPPTTSRSHRIIAVKPLG